MVDIEHIAGILGAVPSVEARSALAEARGKGATEMYVKYDWVKNWDLFNSLLAENKIEFFEGEAGMCIKMIEGV